MKTKLLIFLIVLSGIINAQSSNWLWAKGAGGIVNDMCTDVTTDLSGNIYATGYFSSPTITFGSFTLTNIYPSNTSSEDTADIYVVKYDGSGNVLWARSTGGTFDDESLSITADPGGNVYVTGFFNSPSIIFGSDTLINSGNLSDVFVAKYDPAGNVLWAKSAIGNFLDQAFSIATDNNSNVVITGSFSSSSIVFGADTLVNSGNFADLFVVKYDQGGNVIWARSAVGNAFDQGLGVAITVNGEIVVTGWYLSSTLNFGSTTLTGGNGESFTVKYDASGNVLWAINSIGENFGRSVAVDGNGNIYVSGDFTAPTLILGTDTLTNSNTSIYTIQDLFIAKYDPSGNILWARSSVSAGTNESGTSVTTDNIGNVYMTGWYQGYYTIFGTDTLWNATNGDMEFFLTKYDPAGNVLWAKSEGGIYNEYGRSVTADVNGNIYVGGWYDELSISFGTATLNSAGPGDMFIAKLDAETGVNEWNNNKSKITVYPNPFFSSTILQADNPLHNATLTVYNSFGQTVKEIKNISGQTIVLSRDNLPTGIYVVRLIEENKIVMADKLIITD